MLHREEIVAHFLAHLVRLIERRPQARADLRLRGRALDANFLRQRRRHGNLELRHIDPGLLQNRRGDAALLLQQREQHMGTFQFRMRRFRGQPLRGLQSLLEFLSEFIECHGFEKLMFV